MHWRAGVVGGSIAGCAAAHVMRELGCDVTVFELNPGEPRDRDYGIGIPERVRAELDAVGLVDPALPAMHYTERVWLVRDGARGGPRRLSTGTPARRIFCRCLPLRWNPGAGGPVMPVTIRTDVALPSPGRNNRRARPTMRMPVDHPVDAWHAEVMAAVTELLLVARRHVDFVRVSSAMCRR